MADVSELEMSNIESSLAGLSGRRRSVTQGENIYLYTSELPHVIFFQTALVDFERGGKCTSPCVRHNNDY